MSICLFVYSFTGLYSLSMWFDQSTRFRYMLSILDIFVIVGWMVVGITTLLHSIMQLMAWRKQFPDISIFHLLFHHELPIMWRQWITMSIPMSILWITMGICFLFVSVSSGAQSTAMDVVICIYFCGASLSAAMLMVLLFTYTHSAVHNIRIPLLLYICEVALTLLQIGTAVAMRIVSVITDRYFYVGYSNLVVGIGKQLT